ncbi:PIN domain-containing protein [Hymenobacter armeniacus]|uniref:PIN domain-containing protein n=1 Tax=Hymenobacter armeniacus TaxID=2771358 RepID=UPI0037434ED2
MTRPPPPTWYLPFSWWPPIRIFRKPIYNWQLITADGDDNKFVDVAIAAGAEFLVTNDRHFQVLQAIEFPLVPVISLAGFLDVFWP